MWDGTEIRDGHLTIENKNIGRMQQNCQQRPQVFLRPTRRYLGEIQQATWPYYLFIGFLVRCRWTYRCRCMYKMDGCVRCRRKVASTRYRLLASWMTECDAWAVGLGRTFTRRSTPRSLMRISVQPHCRLKHKSDATAVSKPRECCSESLEWAQATRFSASEICLFSLMMTIFVLYTDIYI